METSRNVCRRDARSFLSHFPFFSLSLRPPPSRNATSEEEKEEVDIFDDSLRLVGENRRGLVGENAKRGMSLLTLRPANTHSHTAHITCVCVCV